MLRFFKLERNSTTFLGHCLKPFYGWITGLFFVVVSLAASSSLKPYALRVLINFFEKYSAEDSLLELNTTVIFYILASLFPVLIYRIHNFIWTNLAPPLRHYAFAIATQSVISKPYVFFQDHPAANLANDIKETVTTLPEFIKTVFDGFLCGFFTLVIATMTVGTINYKFALGLLSWVAIYVIGSIIILRRAKTLGNQGVQLRSKMLSKIVEIFENIKCIRLHDKERFEKNKLQQVLDSYLIIDQQKERCTVKAFALQGFSFIVYQIICLVWLIEGLKQQVFSLGDFALILTMNLTFVDYLRKVTLDIVNFAEIVGKLQQGLKTIVGIPTPEEVTEKQEITQIPGSISFNNVWFNYEGRPPLFKDKSININAGEKVAIVGHSGSGKSTFINLILRLYDVTSGSIFIHGKNIQDLAHPSLCSAISLVPQSPSLFQGTIMENIQYSRIEATESEIIEASKRAKLHDFILTLSEGYNTPIDSFGVKFSAGQRQRIAIARAFLKQSPILILDEAMSHLDTITEVHIQKSLLELMEGKTTIFITHRASTLLLAMDQMLIFDQGKIIERGTHDNLLVLGGVYKSLWDDVESFVNHNTNTGKWRNNDAI